MLFVAPGDLGGQVAMQVEDVAEFDHQLDQGIFLQPRHSIVESRILGFVQRDEVAGKLSHLALKPLI